jgi:AcrR family transcriptional regulator
MNPPRPYRSPRREEQAAATRRALVAAMAGQLGEPGGGELSLPAVAEQAGCALRTVHHHFPDRRGRLGAVAAWAEEALGALPPIAGAGDLPDHCRRSLGRAAADLPRARALAAAAAAEDRRDRRRRTRQLEIAALLTGIGAPPEPTARATAVVAALAAPETLVTLVDGHGLAPADATEAVAETVAAVVASLRAQRRPTT